MLIFNLYLSFYMIVVGLIIFSYKCKHLLLMLLSLEFVVLSLYFMLYLYFYLINSDYFFSMLFLIMTVCEGVIGLSILIILIQVFGNDYFSSFSVLC
uniref:NADH-ubiquinone oxidoreductase chain 4L n=1 Tax=Eucnemidae sp. 4 ACP-2013 TaxID=1434503 RepID=A0A3G4RY46_9COLE|nr:NADH dehydrogenase subunit 4L [Eucnemidae sp. 4 ACP-2013]